MEIGEIVFSDHALEEMERRGVSIDIVLECLGNNATQIEKVRKGRVVCQKIIGKFLYRVFVDIDRQPAVVVTVYRTSKIDKYWREK